MQDRRRAMVWLATSSTKTSGTLERTIPFSVARSTPSILSIPMEEQAITLQRVSDSMKRRLKTGGAMIPSASRAASIASSSDLEATTTTSQPARSRISRSPTSPNVPHGEMTTTFGFTARALPSVGGTIPRLRHPQATPRADPPGLAGGRSGLHVGGHAVQEEPDQALGRPPDDRLAHQGDPPPDVRLAVVAQLRPAGVFPDEGEAPAGLEAAEGAPALDGEDEGVRDTGARRRRWCRCRCP